MGTDEQDIDFDPEAWADKDFTERARMGTRA
jgi:hypothetical protein